MTLFAGHSRPYGGPPVKAQRDALPASAATRLCHVLRPYWPCEEHPGSEGTTLWLGSVHLPYCSIVKNTEQSLSPMWAKVASLSPARRAPDISDVSFRHIQNGIGKIKEWLTNKMLAQKATP